MNKKLKIKKNKRKEGINVKEKNKIKEGYERDFQTFQEVKSFMEIQKKRIENRSRYNFNIICIEAVYQGIDFFCN